MVSLGELARLLHQDAGWQEAGAEDRLRELAARDGMPVLRGFLAAPALAEADALRLYRGVLAEAWRAQEAEQAAAAAPEPPPGPRPPTPAERIALLGGAEHASQLARDRAIPLEPIKVVSRAELDRTRAAYAPTMVPGVPYRLAPDHEVPHESPMPAELMNSRFIRESLEDGFTFPTPLGG